MRSRFEVSKIILELITLIKGANTIVCNEGKVVT